MSIVGFIPVRRIDWNVQSGRWMPYLTRFYIPNVPSGWSLHRTLAERGFLSMVYNLGPCQFTAGTIRHLGMCVQMPHLFAASSCATDRRSCPVR
jgi:hypothetical protein